MKFDEEICEHPLWMTKEYKEYLHAVLLEVPLPNFVKSKDKDDKNK